MQTLKTYKDLFRWKIYSLQFLYLRIDTEAITSPEEGLQTGSVQKVLEDRTSKVPVITDLIVKAVVFGKHVQRCPCNSLTDVQDRNSTN